MTALINDPKLEEKLIAKRQAAGADKFDEVWDGVYVMSPLANDEHQGEYLGSDPVSGFQDH